METTFRQERFAARVQYVVVTETRQGEKQAEIGFVADRRLVGGKLEEGTEEVEPFEGYLRLHLDELGTKADDRRGIARDTIERWTGIKLEDSWESEAGYQRLLEDSPQSIVPGMVGGEILVKNREYDGKVYYDAYFPRTRPKSMTLAELKERFKVPY